MKKDTDILGSLLGLAVVIGSLPWAAFVMTVIWAWFVMPLGLPAIGKAQAFGLTLLVSLFRIKQATTDEEENDLSHKIGFYLGGPAVVLLAGYIAHRFMVA